MQQQKDKSSCNECSEVSVIGTVNPSRVNPTTVPGLQVSTVSSIIDSDSKVVTNFKSDFNSASLVMTKEVPQEVPSVASRDSKMASCHNNECLCRNYRDIFRQKIHENNNMKLTILESTKANIFLQDGSNTLASYDPNCHNVVLVYMNCSISKEELLALLQEIYVTDPVIKVAAEYKVNDTFSDIHILLVYDKLDYKIQKLDYKINFKLMHLTPLIYSCYDIKLWLNKVHKFDLSPICITVLNEIYSDFIMFNSSSNYYANMSLFSYKNMFIKNNSKDYLVRLANIKKDLSEYLNLINSDAINPSCENTFDLSSPELAKNCLWIYSQQELSLSDSFYNVISPLDIYYVNSSCPSFNSYNNQSIVIIKVDNASHMETLCPFIDLVSDCHRMIVKVKGSLCRIFIPIVFILSRSSIAESLFQSNVPYRKIFSDRFREVDADKILVEFNEQVSEEVKNLHLEDDDEVKLLMAKRKQFFNISMLL